MSFQMKTDEELNNQSFDPQKIKMKGLGIQNSFRLTIMILLALPLSPTL